MYSYSRNPLFGGVTGPPQQSQRRNKPTHHSNNQNRQTKQMQISYAPYLVGKMGVGGGSMAADRQY